MSWMGLGPHKHLAGTPQILGHGRYDTSQAVACVSQIWLHVGHLRHVRDDSVHL